MEFLSWHYGIGLNLYFRRWYFAMAWVLHYFSLPLLPLTLFSPWKRLIEEDDRPGFSFQRAFEILTFNLISRVIGAIARTFIFIAGLLVFFPVVLGGLIGLIFWLVLPVVGIPLFVLSDTNSRRFLRHLIIKLKAHPENTLPLLFDNPPGRFILTHLNISLADLTALGNPVTPDWSLVTPDSYADFIKFCLDSGIWSEDKLRSVNLSFLDLQTAARWWDSFHHDSQSEDKQMHFSRPGIGMELLFGYTPQLNQYVTDLSLPQHFSHHLIGRGELVSRLERTLTSGKSVILTGQPGVGKKTVVLEFARRCMDGELGPKMVYKRVLEFDYNFLLSESFDLNKKKAKLSLLLSEAVSAGNIILVIKDLHRLTTSAVEGLDFTDLFEQFLEKRELMIIAISSQTDYERFLAPNVRLRKFFEPIEALPVSKDDALLILFDAVNDGEKNRHIIFTVPALRDILDGSDRYITETPFPEKALEILDHILTYAVTNKLSMVGVDEVNTVISEKTGISLARLTEHEKDLLGNLEEHLHEKLIGQDQAVSLIAKSLRARSVGAKDDSRPVGSFLFLGPTGVGKTQTAKTLAEIYYGSTKNIIRFDMAEYAGEEGLSRLIGSVRENQPGVMTTAIKNHPASLLLLDEIEKAPPQINNLFLSLLDEGSISDAFGKKIVCRHLFVIATSNAGAEYIRNLVTDKKPATEMQKLVLDYVQKNGLFTPEFLNRFDGVVVFTPLSPEQLVKIAGLMLADLAEKLKDKNIYLDITPEVCQKIASDGYEPEFGARPMRRLVDIVLGDLLGKAILKEEIPSGSHIKIVPGQGREEYSLAVG